jgi:hypothetical protein
MKIKMEKHSLQSKFTLLKSKFFPAKIPFSKIQNKNLAEKITLQKNDFYFAKERGPIKMFKFSAILYGKFTRSRI